jgi:hypothetical protein
MDTSGPASLNACSATIFGNPPLPFNGHHCNTLLQKCRVQVPRRCKTATRISAKNSEAATSYSLCHALSPDISESSTPLTSGFAVVQLAVAM